MFWDLGTGKEVESTAPIRFRPVRNLALSPDGHFFVFAEDDKTGSNRVRIWNMTTRKEVAILDGIHACNWVAFSPDGRTLATAHGKTTTSITLWTIPSPQSSGQIDK